MPRLPQLTRARALTALGLSLGAGVATGAAGSVVLGTFLEVPEGEALPEFADAPAPELASSKTDKSAEGGVADLGDNEPQGPSTDGLPELGSGDEGGGLASRRAPSKRSYVDTIVRRNIFDSAATFSNESTDVASQDCKDSKVTLLATVVADMAEYSSALISSGGKSSRALGYKVGDEVSGEGRILTIDQKKVCLDGGGCICMGSDNRSRSVAASGVEGTEEGGVTKVSDTKFIVDRAFMEKQLGSVETLATQIRAVPKTENGEIVGFRLSSVRKGSTFDKLGIKNGDVVHNVNGKALTSADGALGAYQTLSGESNFNFEITRRNQKMTIEYEVR